jgi:hypothetical protein
VLGLTLLIAKRLVTLSETELWANPSPGTLTYKVLAPAGTSGKTQLIVVLVKLVTVAKIPLTLTSGRLTNCEPVMVKASSVG